MNAKELKEKILEYENILRTKDEEMISFLVKKDMVSFLNGLSFYNESQIPLYFCSYFPPEEIIKNVKIFKLMMDNCAELKNNTLNNALYKPNMQKLISVLLSKDVLSSKNEERLKILFSSENIKNFLKEGNTYSYLEKMSYECFCVFNPLLKNGQKVGDLAFLENSKQYDENVKNNEWFWNAVDKKPMRVAAYMYSRGFLNVLSEIIKKYNFKLKDIMFFEKNNEMFFANEFNARMIFKNEENLKFFFNNVDFETRYAKLVGSGMQNLSSINILNIINENEKWDNGLVNYLPKELLMNRMKKNIGENFAKEIKNKV